MAISKITGMAREIINSQESDPELLTAEEENNCGVALRLPAEFIQTAGLYAPSLLTLSEHTRTLADLFAFKNQAQQTLTQYNLKWVVKIAKRMAGKGLPLDELIQEGSLGLIHATEKFDYRRGFKLITYAAPWIRKYMLKALANHHQQHRLQTSLDGPVSPGGTTAQPGTRTHLKDLLEDTSPLTGDEEQRWTIISRLIDQKLADLSPPDLTIVLLRFPLDPNRPGLSYEAIARRYGVSRETIRKQVLQFVKNAAEDPNLKMRARQVGYGVQLSA